MTASREILAALQAQGLSLREVGRAIGRDSSLLSQVAKGSKPGRNLEGSLAELRARLEAGQAAGPVTAPARRTTASGKAARVRRRAVVGGDSWATGKVKRQAASSGARSLQKLLRSAGDVRGRAAVDFTFTRAVTVYNTSGGTTGDETHGHRSSGGQTVTMDLGNARTTARIIDDEYEGNFTAYVLHEMESRGHIGHSVESQVADVELRTWVE